MVLGGDLDVLIEMLRGIGLEHLACTRVEFAASFAGERLIGDVANERMAKAKFARRDPNLHQKLGDLKCSKRSCRVAVLVLSHLL